MTFQSILFYSFALVMLGAAIGVVFSRNPVHSVMFLVLTFFQSAALWLMAEAEFLAIVLVLVYVGAVMVLSLFVVMMLEVNIEAAKRGIARYAFLGIGIALLMVVELMQLIWLRSQGAGGPGGFAATPEGYSNTKELGRLIYTVYVYPFEIAAVILLVAIVAAIALTMRRRPESKYINPSEQIKVNRDDRLRIVKMKSETQTTDGATTDGGNQ